MADSKGGGSLLGDLVTAGVGFGLGLLVLGALTGGEHDDEDDENPNALTKRIGPGALPPGRYQDATFTEIEHKGSEQLAVEKLKSLEPLRQKDIAAWFREVAKDPKATEIVKQELQREQELQSLHEKVRGKVQTGPREQRQSRAWYEEMHAEIAKARKLFGDGEEAEEIVEEIQRRYREGER